jgi:ribonuclease HI
LNQSSFFAETSSSLPTAIAYIDGGARGNPGPAAYGVVMRSPEGKTQELGKYLGIQTNNFAEYSGLLAALEFALQQNFAGLKVFSDSELLVKQMKGQYRVKHPGLKTLFDRAKEMTDQLRSFSIHHVLRAQNKDADRLVNEVLDREATRKTR